MQIYCDGCRKNIGSIADEKIPAGKKVAVTCPVCQKKIILAVEQNQQQSKKPVMPPPSDMPTGHDQPAGEGGAAMRQNLMSQEGSGGAGPAPPPSFYLGGTTKLNIAAGAVFLILLISLGVRFWAFSQKNAMTGPSHVAANQETVWVHANGVLYKLDGSGHLQKELNLAALGIAGPVEDLDVLHDGTLLIGDLATHTIFRCNPDSEGCNGIGPAGDFAIANNFKFLADEEHNRIFIGDTNNHRLLVQSLEGGDEKVLLKRSLSFPNDMFLQENGELLLCDSFHYRVITLDYPGGDSVEETVDPIMFSNFKLQSIAAIFVNKAHTEEAKQEQIEALSEQARDFTMNRPMALARDHNGKLWVASGSEAFMFGAEVRLFDSENNLLNRFDQEVAGCPEDIIRMENSILIADTEKYKIFQVNPDNYLFRDFGDAEFSDILASELGKKNLYTFLIRWAFRFMFLSVGLLVVVYFVGKKIG